MDRGALAAHRTLEGITFGHLKPNVGRSTCATVVHLYAKDTAQVSEEDDEPSYQASNALSVGGIKFTMLRGKEFLFESYLDLNEHISHNEKQGCHGIRVGHEKS